MKSGSVRCRRLVPAVLASLWAALAAGCAAVPSAQPASPGPSPAVAAPRYEVSGSGGRTSGPLRLVRMEVAFDNGRGETTVPTGGGVRAQAVLQFDGNGLFQAVWEADGRPLEEVSVPLSYGNTLTVRLGQSAVVPTFEPGPHRLQLRVKQPAHRFAEPVLRYFVTGEPAGGNR